MAPVPPLTLFRPALARLCTIAAACLSTMSVARAAPADAFTIGAITVTGQRPQLGDMPQEQAGSLLSAQQLRQFDRESVGDALALLPGVTLSTNSRNEQLVYVRGFDARQLPLFIDGIPVYVPYDGYVDFGRFGTGDIAAIQLAKGFSSVAYGPNALGGAINLVSRKPARALEGDAQLSLGSGAQRRATLNLGTNQGAWYAQAGLGYRSADGFRLSSDFVPTPTEDGGLRENADARDGKVSLKLGLTPNRGDEVALSFYRQDGQKGQPPTTGSSGVRYWRWPMWDKQSLYFVSSTALGASERLKLRLYHDRFDNEVRSYTDDSYTTLRTSGRGSVASGRSIYHDRSNGGAVEFESARLQGHLLRAVLQHKTDQHEERDAGAVLQTRHRDALSSFGVEDLVDLAPGWQLSLGAARHRLAPASVFVAGNAYALPAASTATNLQAGLFRELGGDSRAYLTLARKTRLPTLKDRYSQRLGSYVENPDLGAERSLNLELGIQALPIAALLGLRLEAALFASRIDDKIQSVLVAGGRACSADTPCQMRNVGQARVHGLELGISGRLAPALELGANLSWLAQKNVSDPDIRLTDVPNRKLFGYALWRASDAVSLQATLEHNSRRWASDELALGEFTIVGLKGSWQLARGLSVELALTNLLDQDYALDEGYPSPGRSLSLQARYAF